MTKLLYLKIIKNCKIFASKFFYNQKKLKEQSFTKNVKFVKNLNKKSLFSKKYIYSYLKEINSRNETKTSTEKRKDTKQFLRAKSQTVIKKAYRVTFYFGNFGISLEFSTKVG